MVGKVDEMYVRLRAQASSPQSTWRIDSGVGESLAPEDGTIRAAVDWSTSEIGSVFVETLANPPSRTDVGHSTARGDR
jgi:hypothetical protein